MENTNRQYKDSVFVDLFGRDKSAKRNFLSLYNALHGSNLRLKAASLKPLRLDRVLYRSFYNDVSFLVDGKIIVLVEHQSSINENMPLRFLLYIARLYEKLVKKEERYARKLKKIPGPEFYVLYNGLEEYPAQKVLKLSDNFVDSGDNAVLNLELQVPVLNINSSKHPAVLEHCRALAEYSLFVERVRRYSGADPENGFMTAIQECIEAGILKNYLERKTSEVINMLLAEYSYETDLKVQREEARQEGLEQGITQGLEQGLTQGLSQGLSQGLEQKALDTARRMAEDGIPVETICKYTGLSEEEIGHINKNG